ncbi:Nucleolar MIF4G domain-containing protein 1 [Orchesella cincta]|uniref:Nucleolar MIF4G domain-containing protein 1 n=1 Tax=Orchesella cincta TaxID=48709 RepID=A0A1D2MFW1_ORCCI|nr:Nucleolar MIF4G domain-containing protein 1 [Orchesella cincta]
MNTDARRNIFCILMTAEDYLDAFEKLNHLDLRNNQDREIYMSFSTTDRKLMLALQYNLWDRLKDLKSLTSHQRKNLAQLVVHLINDKSLPLSTLKVIEYTEMDKTKLKFLKKVLTGILMQKDVDNMQEIFIKPALSEKLGLFRESLRLFLSHFMLQKSITTTDGSSVESDLSPEEMEALKKRVKMAEKCMTLGKVVFCNM